MHRRFRCRDFDSLFYDAYDNLNKKMTTERSLAVTCGMFMPHPLPNPGITLPRDELLMAKKIQMAEMYRENCLRMTDIQTAKDVPRVCTCFGDTPPRFLDLGGPKGGVMLAAKFDNSTVHENNSKWRGRKGPLHSVWQWQRKNTADSLKSAADFNVAEHGVRSSRVFRQSVLQNRELMADFEN